MEFAAQYAVYAIVAIVIASWFIRAGNDADRRIAVYTAVASTAIAIAIALLIKQIYVHQRPFVVSPDTVLLIDHAADPSFPSDHVTAAFAMAAGIGLYRPRIGSVLLLLAALTAFARVFVGVHYPGDVAGGAALGMIVAVLIWSARGVLAWLDDRIVVRLIPEALR